MASADDVALVSQYWVLEELNLLSFVVHHYPIRGRVVAHQFAVVYHIVCVLL
jgi:hypothetical protein